MYAVHDVHVFSRKCCGLSGGRLFSRRVVPFRISKPFESKPGHETSHLTFCSTRRCSVVLLTCVSYVDSVDMSLDRFGRSAAGSGSRVFRPWERTSHKRTLASR